MISWLLFKKSVQQSFGRLALTAGAITLGIIMVLAFASGVNSLERRGNHNDWRYQIFSPASQQPVGGVSPLLAMTFSAGNLNKWQHQNIWTVSLRATGANSPQLPKLRTPEAGEYYVSPALEKIIQAHPESDVGSRFGTKKLGVIPNELLASPDSLDVIRGLGDAELQGIVKPVKVYTIKANEKGVSKYSGAIGTVLIIGAVILLFPIVQFVVIATQLGSVQREKRYAALRLVGATKHQVTRIIMLESFMAALAGVLVGTLVYFLAVKPLIGRFYFDGMRFWQNDITVTVVQYLIIIVLTLLLCLLANWWGMRHVQSSPLGIMRNQRVEKRPRTWRAILLVLGLGIFVWLATFGKNWATTAAAKSDILPLLLIIGGVITTMLGLVFAGSWLTYGASKLIATLTKNPRIFLASKRIHVHSKQIFRSVSGIVLALFAGSFYLTATGGIEHLSVQSVQANGYSRIKPGKVLVISDVPFESTFESKLKSQPYIVSSLKLPTEETKRGTVYYTPCSQLNNYMKLNCPEGRVHEVASINFENLRDDQIKTIVKPASDIEASNAYLVAVDSDESLDKLRTFIAKQTQNFMNPTHVISGTYAQKPILNPVIRELAQLAYVGIGVTMLIAAVSLIVSTLGGILERQRSLATLRLQGMMVKDLQRVVMIESLIPMLTTSVLAGGIGVWVGTVFVRLFSEGLQPAVTPVYWLITLGCLACAVIGISSILPVIGRVTKLSANRTE